jgi:hypothetical protein
MMNVMVYNQGIKLELIPPVFSKMGISTALKIIVNVLPERLTRPFSLKKNRDTNMHGKAHKVGKKLAFFMVSDNRNRLAMDRNT